MKLSAYSRNDKCGSVWSGQSGRDERCGWQGQEGQVTENIECHAEDFGSHPTAIETLSPAPILVSATQDTIKASIPK